MYNEPLPQPLLVPWVDLTGVSSLGGVTIPAADQKLYRSVFHAGMLTPLPSAVSNLMVIGSWEITSGGPVLNYDGSHTFTINSGTMQGFPMYPSTQATYRNQAFWVNDGIIDRSFGDFRIDGNTYAAPDTVSDICLKQQELSTTQLFNTDFYSYLNYPATHYLRFTGYEPLSNRKKQLNCCLINGFSNNVDIAYSEDDCNNLAIIRAKSLLSTTFLPIGFFPSRPLPSAPELVESITSIDHVTIGGRTYHAQHSQRKLWNCEILLDGGLDCVPFELYKWVDSGGRGWQQLSDGTTLGRGLDAVTGFDLFLKHAEKGVTLWVDRWCGAGKHIRPNYSVAFPGVPNMISGQLINCSQVKLAYSNGLNRRYKVTLTIAEEDPF